MESIFWFDELLAAAVVVIVLIPGVIPYAMSRIQPVSYTHLDVYKRQALHRQADRRRGGQRHLQHRAGRQAAGRLGGHLQGCLLYTSRCV